MNRFLHKIVAATVISGVSLTSCESYLDVNDNPNYPIEADISTLLPSACASTIAVLGYNGGTDRHYVVAVHHTGKYHQPV